MWNDWYSQYIDRPIFISRGTVGLQEPSHYFNKYFTKGNVERIGKVVRLGCFSEREIVNSSFVAFCQRSSRALPGGYRKAFTNLRAGYLSASKYDKGQPKLDEGAWLLAGDWTKNHFTEFMSNSEVLDLETVLGEIPKTTSPGYPWNRKFVKKSEMLADERACAVFNDYWDLIGTANENNIVPIWTCSQKVEMRAIEKLRENSLRTFTACPFELSVATNRLCLDANNGFYLGARSTFSAVGMSKFLSGWDQMYRRMTERFNNAFELDESQYDSSLFRAALFGQRDIRISFLRLEDRTEANVQRMHAVYDSIVNSVIVMDGGELIQKDTGNPSGSSNTVVDNTMILFRLFVYAWILLCREQGRKTEYLDFMKHVCAVLYGDDNTYTCSDEVVGWFEPVNISRIWTAIGITTKTPCEKPRKLEEVAFLSNSFHYSEDLGMWFPVPETDRVLSSLCYGSDVDDVRWHFLRACALRLDSYWNLEVRGVLDSYIAYLNKMHGGELVGEINGLSMMQIRNVWKSEDWIEALYCGLERSVMQYALMPVEIKQLSSL